MSDLIVSKITYFGQPSILACDGNCKKAWGISQRPFIQLSEDDDDIVFLSDTETDEAPRNPGTSEGGYFKPTDKRHNKWCARECERSEICKASEIPVLKNWSDRRYNQPWKHEGSNV